MESMQQASPFEQRSLARLIKAFGTLDSTSLGTSSADAEEKLPDIETAGSLLWDLTADPDAVATLLQCSLLSVIHGHITTCCTASARDVFSSGCSVGRVLELCCGMLANLYASPGAVQHLTADTATLQTTVEVFMSIDDPAALSEICRMLVAALASPQGSAAWLPILQTQSALAHLLLLIQNTLNVQLLEHSISLLAAVLHASQLQATEGTGALQHHSTIRQQLWSLGLADALLTVLEPATKVSYNHAMLATAEDATEGTWDDVPQTAHTDYATASQTEQRLYRQASVLEALLAVAQQLAMDPCDADDTVHHMPQLPQLLLQLLTTCSTAEQQEVLELLLPVLVMFRRSVVPLLHQHEQPQLAASKRKQSDGSGTEQQECSLGEQQRQQQSLQQLVCLAVVLSDCSYDSLDALDAGWFLCAAATKGLWLQHEQHGTAMEAAKTSSQLQVQNADDIAPAANITVSCQALECLCRQLSLAHVPETAVGYAEQCARNIVLAIAAVTQGQRCEDAACSLQELQDGVSSLHTAARYIGALAKSLQEQSENANASSDEHTAALQEIQQDALVLQQLLQELVNGQDAEPECFGCLGGPS